MGRRTNESFVDAAQLNMRTYKRYLNTLTELALSMFDWQRLPETVDGRYLELSLFRRGSAVYFDDPDIGNLALKAILSGGFDVYNIPLERTAYAANGYRKMLNRTNSVIIWNNLIHEPSYSDIELFARRLANLDRIIDVNANAQKTPIMIECDEQERLTVENIYMQYDGNIPVIFGRKGISNGKPLNVLQTDAPFVGKNIYELKTLIWNEAMTYLGISNVNTVKRERMITDEVLRNLGGTVASRYSRLEARREACRQINRMFGTNIWVDYREDYSIADDTDETTDGKENDKDEGGDEE